MRIALVSAHYPPNFVSGGTLQPQRLARGLHQLGHDVHVYAGHLDEHRAPLSTWSEDDGHGVHVRWIVTTPYIGWSDDANWNNPAVASDFRGWLDQIDPDVVHLHSLQSLGGELVTAAKDAGAAVVVTMHDFWWCCARQFLVDRSFVPCSLVVDTGVCPCEVSNEWAASRARRLREWIGHADAVLAPSAIAAAALQANGLPAIVDENGLPPESRTAVGAPGHRAHATTRFVYAGGPHEMKGVHVLVEAARLLASDIGTDRWTLTAYGAAPYLADHGLDPRRLHVEVRDPFAPDELASVLASADALVLPSVMRETHSLLTREALLAGVPVVATDSLGPEEVVVDGVNGIIVPAGDAPSLAEALRRVVVDDELRTRLRTGTAERPVAIRTLDDQVAGLDARYTKLTAPAAATTATATPASIRRVVFMVGIEGAPLRYRARLPAEALGLLGVESDVCHYRDLRLPDLIAKADALVVYRVPATVQVLDLIEGARTRGIPVVFDVDDLIFDPDIADEIPALRILDPDDAALWLQGVRRYRTTMEHCDGYIASTPTLAQHAASVVGLPTARFDNGVGILVGRRSDAAVRRPRAPGPLRLGYFSGTTTHDDDWRYVEGAVADVLDAHPTVELWLGGYLALGPALDRFGDRVRRLPFMAWHELPEVLRDLDVNLAPLEPHGRFNDAKSAIKWLEAALCTTPTIATPTEPFRMAIEPGVNGLLATEPSEWAATISQLLDDDLLRERLGHRARRDALLRWSPHLQGHRYLAILEAAREWRDSTSARRAATAWEPTALDEPLIDAPLEPYDDHPSLGVPSASAPIATPSVMARVKHSLRNDGLLTTVRRAGAGLRRRVRR